MKWYLIKASGSQGVIFDFSQAQVVNTNELIEYARKIGAEDGSEYIQYVGYDKRINMHSWHLLANHSGYKAQHVVWIYSPTSDKPHLSEYYSPYKSEKDIESERLRDNIKVIK